MGTQLETRRILSISMKDHIAFKRGNLSGRYWYLDTFGQLPQVWRIELKAAYDEFQTYVVFSWQTPIAWRSLRHNAEWVIPDVTYSVTTSHHQSLVRVEAHNPGFYERMAFERSY